MGYRFIRPLLFSLPPELAQTFAIGALKLQANWFGRPKNLVTDDQTSVDLLGLKFPNRIGLAAGFDKSAEHIDELGRLRFGFIEIGTVTPQAQAGHPSPNLFRLVEDNALINRMGFNNAGVDVVVRRLEKRRYSGICGVNIGKNRDTALTEAARDYVVCLQAVYNVADYVTVNISSPNTAGLRELQGADALSSLLTELLSARERLIAANKKFVPLLVKVAPDLDEMEIDSIAKILRDSGVDGVVATNTTITRPLLKSRHAAQTGGLSGRPLQPLSLRVIRVLRERLGRAFPIVGVGGVASAADAHAMFEAGADLLQIYSGLIYEGPGLVAKLIAESRRLKSTATASSAIHTA